MNELQSTAKYAIDSVSFALVNNLYFSKTAEKSKSYLNLFFMD